MKRLLAILILFMIFSCKKQTDSQQNNQQQSSIEIGKPTGALYQANSQTVGMRYSFYITINDSTQLKELNCYQQTPKDLMWHYTGPWKSGSYFFNRVTGDKYVLYYFEIVFKNGTSQQLPSWQIQ